MAISSKSRVILSWLSRLLAAAILGMAGFMKVTGASDAVALFTFLGVEPWGRFLLGSVELLTALLLLWPKSAVAGALIGGTLMIGAIGTHLFRIGITYGGDPSLFVMAWVVLLASGATIVLSREPKG